MGVNLLPNQIICGDNIEILKTFPDDVIDLTVTSPPYDDMRDYEGYSFDFETLAKELYRVTKPGGLIAWIVGDSTKDGDESCTSFKQALYFKSIGFKLFDTMIYEKNPRGAVGSNRSYWQTFEYMFVFSKGPAKTNNLINDRVVAYTVFQTTMRQKDGSLKKSPLKQMSKIGKRTNIWKYTTGFLHTTKDKFAYKHPALFPEKLAADHIKSWSNKGDLILDPFCGAGTTLKMAKLHWRDYIGIDVSQKYCDMSKQRVSQETIL